MEPDANAGYLASVYNLESPSFVQNPYYGTSVMSTLSGCDLMPVVNLDDPAVRKLEGECLERVS